jgi:hypothetical protein
MYQEIEQIRPNFQNIATINFVKLVKNRIKNILELIKNHSAEAKSSFKDFFPFYGNYRKNKYFNKMVISISKQLNIQIGDKKTINEFSKIIFSSIQKKWYQTNLYSFGLTTFIGGIFTLGVGFVVSGFAKAAGVITTCAIAATGATTASSGLFFGLNPTNIHQDTQNVVQTLKTMTQGFINNFDSKVHDETTYLCGIIFLSSLCHIYIKQNSFKLNLEQILKEAPEIIKMIAQDLQKQLTKT